MSYVKKNQEELKIPEISLKEFDEISEKHQFSQKYERRKNMLIKEYKENREKLPKHRSFRVAAAVAAVCIIGTAGVYATVSNGDFFNNVFGNRGRESVKTHAEIQDQGDKGKTPVQVPAREYVTVDADVAEKNIGDYVMNQPMTKKIKDHTLTILSAVRDKNCMIMEFTLEKKGGEDALVYNDKTNMSKGAYFSDNADISFDMYAGENLGADCIYVDKKKSTKEKLYCYDYIVFDKEMKEGKSVSMRIETAEGALLDTDLKDIHEETLEIPVTKTAPVITYTSEQGGRLEISSLGMLLDMEKGLGLKGDAAHDPGHLESIKVQYKDGTEYVVEDENVYNVGYSCGFDGEYKLTFNRLVELDKIDSIKVNGIVYHAE